MNKYGDEVLKLSNQICFPLYAGGKEIVRKYQPYLEKYDLTYTINYKNYTKSIKREVNVVDIEPPVINIECDDEIYSVVKEKLNTCHYTVTDNYDSQNNIKVEEISNVDENKVGDYTITIKATDSSDNVSEKNIIVHIRRKNELNYIEVSISKQRLDYYENGKLYLSTPITSGAHNKTPKGSFKVFNKAKNTYLKSGTYTTFVKYWIGFKGYRYGIHDASWRNNFGNMNYYNNGSHGCINTPTNAVKELYSRVKVGMPVYIKD